MPVLWYAVCPDHPILLVIVCDPDGRQPDDFFFSTDPVMTPEAVASGYAGRWSIEDTNRNVKQFLGGEDPQCWAESGPARAAALSMWLYSTVWLWYLAYHGSRPTWTSRPWYTAKHTPSFADALAALRRALWTSRLSRTPIRGRSPRKLRSSWWRCWRRQHDEFSVVTPASYAIIATLRNPTPMVS